MNTAANVLIGLGVFALAVSLVPARNVLTHLPQGKIRLSWQILFILILFFITGYLCYSWASWSKYEKLFDLLVPAIFFFGALFVVVVNTLSFYTSINLNRIDHLERENITDSLMGIYNRRFFDRRLIEEVSRCKRYNLPLSVLLIDIDSFKNVNDAFGHPTGDSVLINLGQLLVNGARNSDIVARYGGEEIAIMTPNTKSRAAAVLAERLRDKVERSELVASDEARSRDPIKITVSIGVASLELDHDNSDNLIDKADKALYQAKQSGRNRVIFS